MSVNVLQLLHVTPLVHIRPASRGDLDNLNRQSKYEKFVWYFSDPSSR